MTTALEKTLKRGLRIDGRIFVVAISPESLKLTLKGKRKGLELCAPAHALSRGCRRRA